MNGLSCVKGEIHNVLAVLRITGRDTSIGGGFFSSRSTTQSDNIEILRHKLLTSFKELHLFLTLDRGGGVCRLDEVDTCLFIRPFCDVILSEGIGGIDVMNITLTSIHKFLLYQLITKKSINSFEAINNILIESIFNISFDDNSRSDKELIHIRLMEIILELLRNSCGYLLTNDNVCLCVQKCFEIRLYHRNYNKTNNCLMVRYTENVLIQLILLIFNKIKVLSHDNNKFNDQYDSRSFNERAMIRILKYLTIIINPNQLDTSQDIREFGLRLINVALETAGNYLNNYSSLIKIIQDDLCRQLLINSQSNNFLILSLTLRVIFDLFSYLKQQIRVQLEVFFISIHLRIAESQSSSFEQKELVLESIVEFCREPDLIIGLYTNYDCQVGSTHLFEDLCNFLLNKATEGIHITDNNNKINNLHLIAAEGILAIIDCIARKFIDNNINNEEEKKQEEYEQITQQQKRKRKLKLSARCFNNKLGKSFEYLQQIATLKTPLNPLDVSKFLHTNSYLDKLKIGEYLGKKKEFNTKVLDCYVDLFDFKGMTPDQALRYFLESFVLRGEAQQIERIIENFSKKLYDDKPENSPLKSKDSAFLLAYSMIQLNTDAHNDQIKNKMTLDAYKRNLKGVNDGESFPDKFINKIYFSITTNEIKVRSGNFKDIFNDQQQSMTEYYFDDRLFDDEDDEEYHNEIFSDEDNNNNNNNDNNNINNTPSKDNNNNNFNDNHSVSSSGSSFFLDPYSSTYNVKDVKKSEWMQILKKSQKLHKFTTIAPPTNGAEMFNILWEPALSILQFHLRFAGHPKVLDRVVQV